jgi:pyruvate,water dikinase
MSEAPSLYIAPFDLAPESDYPRMGGKCTSLSRMIKAGVRVPPGFAVTTDAYARHLKVNHLGARIDDIARSIDVDDIEDEAQKAALIRAAITQSPIPADVETAIRAAYLAMSPHDDLPVAVRSSATAEDMPDASFAGQQDTYLWVVGADEVVGKVRECWGSLFNARAISYRTKNQIGLTDALMSVGVQKMVDASAAGVAMTLDPITGDRTKIVIDAAFGLGEPVVSGDITPDNFVVEKVMMTIGRRRIADKDFELIADRAARRTRSQPIEPERRGQPSLSDTQIIAVAKQLERSMGGPQDVEWAVDRDLPVEDGVVALQSRPETVWSRKPRAPANQSFSTGTAGVLGALLSPLASKAP